MHVEMEIENMLRPCENSVRGCKRRMPPDAINVHEKHCDFKRHVCASVVGPEGCSWAGTHNNLTQHILREHFAIISDDFKYDFVIKNYSQVNHFNAEILMTSFHHLFLAKLEYDGIDEVFYGGVQFVSGTPGIASEFRYEFEVGKETENSMAHYKFIFSRQPHALSEEYNKRTISDHFRFNKDIGKFFTDTNDTLTVTVVIKSVQSLARKNVEAEKTYGFVPSQYCQRCVSSFNPTPLT
jgi:hypothetical protein